MEALLQEGSRGIQKAEGCSPLTPPRTGQEAEVNYCSKRCLPLRCLTQLPAKPQDLEPFIVLRDNKAVFLELPFDMGAAEG